MKLFTMGSFNDREVARYRYLRNFALRKFHSETGLPTSTVEVALACGDEDDSDTLSVTFFGVTDLKAGDLNSWLASALHVSDISSWQWEGACFRVVDLENVWFPLNCEDIDIRVQPKPHRPEVHRTFSATAAGLSSRAS